MTLAPSTAFTLMHHRIDDVTAPWRLVKEQELRSPAGFTKVKLYDSDHDGSPDIMEVDRGSARSITAYDPQGRRVMTALAEGKQPISQVQVYEWIDANQGVYRAVSDRNGDGEIDYRSEADIFNPETAMFSDALSNIARQYGFKSHWETRHAAAQKDTDGRWSYKDAGVRVPLDTSTSPDFAPRFNEAKVDQVKRRLSEGWTSTPPYSGGMDHNV
ncbi:MAG: hypothetical protein H6729_01010 [Deltaproteobacteria bacterium]|nr:hypothetical protein [Deltaproteobacteria bacterium]